VKPKTEAMPPPQAPFLHPGLIGLRPVRIPDQASFIIWIKFLLPFILTGKMNLEWLMKYISRYHFISPH
jgi:hypothetical protein